MWKLIKGPGKWLIVIPGFILAGLVYTGMSSPQAAATGYSNGAKAFGWGSGVAAYTVPVMLKAFTEGGTFVNNSANKGTSTVPQQGGAAANSKKAKKAANPQPGIPTVP